MKAIKERKIASDHLLQRNRTIIQRTVRTHKTQDFATEIEVENGKKIFNMNIT